MQGLLFVVSRHCFFNEIVYFCISQRFIHYYILDNGQQETHRHTMRTGRMDTEERRVESTANSTEHNFQIRQF